MRQFEIHKDQIHNLGTTERLGTSAKAFSESNVPKIPENYDGWIPFTRWCFSLGDIGIISGMFEALKIKYPKAKIAWPSDKWLETVFIPEYRLHWDVNNLVNTYSNIINIFGENKFIDYRFDPGDFDWVFTDHDRVYKDENLEEPLVEQLLRRFGFTEDDLRTIDSRPKIYFTEKETLYYRNEMHKFIDKYPYGCLLFSSRTHVLRSTLEELEALKPAAELYKNTPVFYYSDYDLKGTMWEKYFPQMINFKDTGFSIRQQLFIKYNAAFNISVQAGISDATSGYTDYHVYTPLDSPKENVQRGATYYFKSGKIQKF